MTALILVSPLAGWSAPLEEVPDPVFADRVMGDGVAVDPVIGALHAPCDGVVIMSAKHALTLRSDSGVEILLHVGLETVALKGEGFTAAPREGTRVAAGDVLFTFDLDVLGAKAKSLISPVIVANSDRFRIVRRVTGREVAVGDILMELAPLDVSQDAAKPSVTNATGTIIVPAVHGLHARPAALIANLARTFSATITLTHGERRADARSTTALMALHVSLNDHVTIDASGKDGKAAVEALRKLIETGLDKTEGEAPQLLPVTAARSEHPDVLAGTCAVPGLALGRAVQFRPLDREITETGRGIALETSELNRAVEAVKAKIAAAASGSRARRDILNAHLSLLEDPELQQAALHAIEQGKSAGFAWRSALRAAASVLESLGAARLRERAGDLLDLERQVLTALSGETAEPAIALPAEGILLAEDLLPSELMSLDTARLKGLVTAKGGPTSHVAILAAGMNLPALVGVGEGVANIEDGAELLLDAGAGYLYAKPDAETRARAQQKIAAAAEQRARALALAACECRTMDGIRIEVFANLGRGGDEAVSAVAMGAEGCGLLRTEFLFMERETAPTEDEQLKAYQAISDALAGRPFILRTLDIGADKPAPYLPFPAEANPVLGIRGVRVGLRWPDLLRTQLKAALRVKPQCRILLPMINEVAEIRTVRSVLNELCESLQVPAPPLGVMIETPAAAMTADRLAGEADFFSVGTNDLSQYTLAIDRTHPDIARNLDALHPAVLRLIRQAAEAAAAASKPIGVCGGLGADPLAAPVLIGLGVTELSVPPSAIAAVKARIRTLRVDQCRDIALAALACDSASEVRAVLNSRLANLAENRT